MHFSSNFTKGVDWAKRRKILRISKYKQKQSQIKHTQISKQEKEEDESDETTNTEDPNADDDVFLSRIVNPNSPKVSFIKRKYNKIHGITDDILSKTDSHTLRPSLFTTMIKNTRDPHKLLDLWFRDRKQCPIDYINCSAIIVHLAQLCLEQINPEYIYDKTMSWGLIRIIRDIMNEIDNYDIRQIANIMWSIGVLTSNKNDKIHRDFRRLVAKLINKFENDVEIRRKCNVQNMVDMLWCMDCTQLNVHKFFYQFCIDIYCKLDIDIGVTPDSLAYIAVLYAQRIKIKEKSKGNRKDMDEVVPKEFWLKLLKEFSDDFVLIESSAHQIANIIWSISRIGNKYLSIENTINLFEEEFIINSINKLLTFVQDNKLNECDGKTLSILLWSVSCSNYKPLLICKKHPIFDFNNKNSISSRILKLIEHQDCYLIPQNNNNTKDDYNNFIYSQKYSTKAYNISLNDFIIIFESVIDLPYSIPPYILTLILNRIKQQLKYAKIDTRDLLSLMESIDLLGLNNDEEIYQIISKKLTKAISERSKSEWNYNEYIFLLNIINKYEIFHKNLDLIYNIFKSMLFTKQGWGKFDFAPIQLLNEQVVLLESHLIENNLLLLNIDQNNSTVSDNNEDEDDDVNNNDQNLSVLLNDIKQKIAKRIPS